MNEEKTKNLDFFSAIAILYRYRKFLIVSHLVVGTISLIVSLILPKTYKSTATVMINPTEQFLGIPGDLQEIIPTNLFGGVSNDVDQFLAILNSTAMADSVIARFDLFKVYDVKYRKQVYERFHDNVGFIDNDDGTITLFAKYKSSPEKAKDMAEFIVDTLNRINLKLNNERTKNSRIFLEQEYQRVKDNVKDSDKRFTSLQSKYGFVDFSEQIKASIILMGELETKRMLSKIELQSLSNKYGPDHPLVKNIKEQLNSFDKEISNLTNQFHQSSVVLPLKKVPDLGLEYFETYREFKINEAIFEFITPIYEKTKLEELKNVPNFVVLDYPAVPDYKDSPKRALIVIVTVILFSVVSTFTILLREYYRMNRGVFHQLLTKQEDEDRE